MEYRLLVNGARMPALGSARGSLRARTRRARWRRPSPSATATSTPRRPTRTSARVGQGIADSGIDRAELFVTTKVWTSNFHHGDVLRSADESLAKLGTDYVDLLLMHWPNPDVPLKETLGALQELQKAGKARAIGVSNFPVALMREAAEALKAPIACNQVEYHAMLSQKPVIEYAHAHGIVVTAYSPLGRGGLADGGVLERIGKQYGKTPQQVALRWLIEQPDVAAIPKTSSEKHARANFDIFDFKLSDADRAAIDALGGDNRLINPAWAPRWDNAA